MPKDWIDNAVERHSEREEEELVVVGRKGGRAASR